MSMQDPSASATSGTEGRKSLISHIRLLLMKGKEGMR